MTPAHGDEQHEPGRSTRAPAAPESGVVGAVEARTVGGLAGTPATRQHIFQLDGWRGISILCVLAAHLLPLGPDRWKLNGEAGLVGMSLFFTLSGYLITSFLLRRPQVKPFLIRRLMRILPLAWLFLAVVFLIEQAPLSIYPSGFFFYLNYYVQDIRPYDTHFWSLCVEMHFYLFVALVVALAGRRGLYILPLVCLAVTGWRMGTGTTEAIATLRRVDEILAGATLALIFAGSLPEALAWPMRRGAPWLWLGVLLVVANPHAGALQYLRPLRRGGAGRCDPLSAHSLPDPASGQPRAQVLRHHLLRSVRRSRPAAHRVVRRRLRRLALPGQTPDHHGVERGSGPPFDVLLGSSVDRAGQTPDPSGASPGPREYGRVGPRA